MITWIKKYFSPYKKEIPSLYNGILEITMVKGKKVLNTRRTNYSFGSVHKVMQFALGKISINKYANMLLLGLGAGSVIDIIRNELSLNNPINAIELDPVIIEVARKEFELVSYPFVTVKCMDAYKYVEQENKHYELIIIDLFIDINIPAQFYEDEFWKNICRITDFNGSIIFNTIKETTPKGKIENIINGLKESGFDVTVFNRVEIENLVIIAKR